MDFDMKSIIYSYNLVWIMSLLPFTHLQDKVYKTGISILFFRVRFGHVTWESQRNVAEGDTHQPYPEDTCLSNLRRS